LDLLTYIFSQLESKKNLIEAELNNRLLPRKKEIEARLEAAADAESGDASSAGDLDARTRELQNLNNSIQALTKKVQCMCTSSYPGGSLDS
jgi:hypothetical protein